MDILTNVINTLIIDPLVRCIKKHVGFFVSARKHVQDMNDKMEILELRASDTNRKKEENDDNSRRVPAEVSGWLEKVEKVKGDAESVAMGGGNVCFNMKTRYIAGKQSCGILLEIERLIDIEDKFKWTNDQRPLGKSRSNKPSTSASPALAAVDHNDSSTQNRFKSREMIFEQALKSLDPRNNDNNTQKIALCGMGGVGKTTMMEQLKKAVDNTNMFNWVMKADIGQNPNTIAVQQAIADYMGGSLTEKDKGARADRLRERFEERIKSGKKILVILDDLWNKFDLKDIGLVTPLPNGIKLLLTSRFDNVCSQMGVKPNSILKVGVLNDEEAETLFFQTVELSEDDDADAELHKIGEDIAKKCGGLPIAIKTIASSLKDDIKDAWTIALSRLESHDLQDLDAIGKDIFGMSYNNLRNDEDKAIFLLCGLFPDDFNIPMEDLKRYGWGLKLFKKVYSIEEARKRTKACVNNLRRANLLTESDIPGCVKMHDLVREFVLSNFTKVKQASVVNHDNKSEWPTEDARESCERILLDCKGMSEFPVDFNYPNLKLLRLQNGKELPKLPEDFYEKMKKLEVIAYADMEDPFLPRSLQCSTNLRSLCLYRCTLTSDCSYIEDLVNLEVLSFAYCGIINLPSTIGKLRKLRLLDLTGCRNLSIDDGVFQNLENLEELYMACFSITLPIRFTEANCNELKALSTKLVALQIEFFENKAQPENVSFENLERFMISMGCSLRYDVIGNTLRLVTNRKKLLECKIYELFKKTERLFLKVKDMDHIEDFSAHPSQPSFCNLRELEVFYCEDLTYLFTIPVAIGLTKLERLDVSSCPVLKVLINGESENSGGMDQIEDISAHPSQRIFCNLRDLEVSNCSDLTYLFTIPVAIGLTKLERLDVSSCPVLKELIHGESENSGGMVIKFEYLNYLCLNALPELISLCDNLIELPRLVGLDLSNLPNFTSIYYDDNDSSVMRPIFKKEVKTPKLKYITVENCDGLVNLFPTNPMQLLSHLEVLRVEECGSVEVLFNIDLECVGNMEQVSSRLREIYASNLGKLREVWRIKGSAANNSIRSFQAVETIYIEDCKMFRNIFTPVTSKYLHMGPLVDIRMINCGESDSEINDISKEGDDNNVAFPSHLIHTFHHLYKLHLENYKGMEVVFDIAESPTQQQSLLLPHLHKLHLDSMDMMSHVWKCYNWKEFVILQKQHPQSSFHNLTTIKMKQCNNIKYLFSPLMAKLFSNLKKIDIQNCDGIEEVVSNRDDEQVIISSHTNTTFFPHLDKLRLLDLNNLKRIDGGVIHDRHKLFHARDVSWSLCQYSRKIEIEGCDALSSVVPSYALGQMQKLQELKIRECDSMTEVFETQGINNNDGGGSSTNIDEGNGSTTLAIPRLENLNVPQLSNLTRLEIDYCHRLQHVFTFSTLKSLRQLQELSVKNCNAMKVIVTEENGEQTNIASNVVVFPSLKSVKLLDLPDFKGFFLGMNDFQWPLLDKVVIGNCPQITVFTSGHSTAPELKYIHTSFGIHSLECGLSRHVTPTLDQTQLPSSESTSSPPAKPWSFQNLIEINSEYMTDGVKKIIPSNELLLLQKLEKIHLKSHWEVEEVFEIALELEGSDINSGVNDLQTVVEIPNLRQVELEHLHNLKYIWKSNGLRVVEFPNLTTLYINDCGNLEHVFTSTMLGSLQQLQDLSIHNCKNMEVIMKEEEECDFNVNEIKLRCLKSLELIDLKNLKGFYLGKEAFFWPSLDTLVIKFCPAITVFTDGQSTTPKLQIIETSFGRCDVREELNSFIKTKQQQGLEF